MTMPQPGIFAQGNTENAYLEFDLDRPETLEDALRALFRIPAAYNAIDVGDVDLLITDHPLPTAFPTLPTEVLHP